LIPFHELRHYDLITVTTTMATGEKKNEKNEFVLISLGLDGKILLWNVSPVDLNDMIPTKAFAVSTQDLGKSLPTHSDKNSLRSEVGIAAASFSPENETLFAIGCCGGSVLLCSLHHSLHPHPKQEADLILRSTNEQHENKFDTPVQMAYIPHRSTICCMEFAPAGRNLFVSASADGEVRVYNALDSKPVALIHLEFGPTSACFWSKERLLIYCLASGGAIRSMTLTHDASHHTSGSGSSSRLCFTSNPFQDQDEGEVCNLWLNSWNKGDEQLCLLSSRGELSIWSTTN
jgi:WD40 repeat protein